MKEIRSRTYGITCGTPPKSAEIRGAERRNQSLRTKRPRKPTTTRPDANFPNHSARAELPRTTRAKRRENYSPTCKTQSKTLLLKAQLRKQNSPRGKLPSNQSAHKKQTGKQLTANKKHPTLTPTHTNNTDTHKHSLAHALFHTTTKNK